MGPGLSLKEWGDNPAPRIGAASLRWAEQLQTGAAKEEWVRNYWKESLSDFGVWRQIESISVYPPCINHWLLKKHSKDFLESSRVLIYVRFPFQSVRQCEIFLNFFVNEDTCRVFSLWTWYFLQVKVLDAKTKQQICFLNKVFLHTNCGIC